MTGGAGSLSPPPVLILQRLLFRHCLQHRQAATPLGTLSLFQLSIWFTVVVMPAGSSWEDELVRLLTEQLY